MVQHHDAHGDAASLTPKARTRTAGRTSGRTAGRWQWMRQLHRLRWKGRAALVAAVVATLALGATFAAWQTTQLLSSPAITTGDLDITADSSTIVWYDISPDRQDIGPLVLDGQPLIIDGQQIFGHPITNIDEWAMVPGDTVLAVSVAQITLHGDNLVACLSAQSSDHDAVGSEAVVSHAASIKDDVSVVLAIGSQHVEPHQRPAAGESLVLMGTATYPQDSFEPMAVLEAPRLGQDQGKSVSTRTTDSMGNGVLTLYQEEGSPASTPIYMMVAATLSDQTMDRDLTNETITVISDYMLKLRQVRTADGVVTTTGDNIIDLCSPPARPTPTPTPTPDPTPEPTPDPEVEPELEDAYFIQTIASHSHSVGLTESGHLWTWGSNEYGLTGLGLDTGTTRKPTPLPNPPGVTKFVSIAVGQWHSVAIADDGSLWTWGYNVNGRTGLGLNTGATTVPTRIPTPEGVTGFVQVNAGNSHTVALADDGSLWAWGNNANGRTGLGTMDGVTLTPQRISNPAGVSGFTHVDVGLNHSLAIADNDTLWTWGSNAAGQGGIGVMHTSLSTPTMVQLPADARDFTHLSAGQSHSMLLAQDGTLWVWGSNSNGRTGLGTTEGNATLPVHLEMPDNVDKFVRISGGSTFSLAVASDGSLWSWGYNADGRTGLGITAGNTLTPQRITTPAGITGFVDVSAGNGHSLAIADDGSLWAWGNNQGSQTGLDTDSTAITTPQWVMWNQ